MSDNKKYYYLKFKENYFEQDHIKYLESMDNGHTYSLILVKLYLKAIKHDGQLRVNEFVPYTADKISMLAKIIGHDPDHVMHAVNTAHSLGLIEIVSSGEMWIADIQNFIGHSSTEADRVRDYRKKIAKLPQTSNKAQKRSKKTLQSVHLYDRGTPELDIETDKEIELDIDIDQAFNMFWNTYDKKIDKRKCYSKWRKLSSEEKDSALNYIPAYVRATPEKQYRKHPATFLNNKAWENEIIQRPAQTKGTGNEPAIQAYLDSLKEEENGKG